ncbi:unnamed protein product [Blepharisma stoltei]|uniref:Uncharacterized protein n=1 Tax=Blepharisma stoltei TaxID=1481888 RepID=A0AAU9KDP1_9CILI|nr:unnamed protein product [Blepharisma stoltei]
MANLFKEKPPTLETLIDLALQEEREKYEANARRTLEILTIKDNTIQDLQRIIGDQRHEIAELEHQLDDARVLLLNTEKSLESAYQTIEELKTNNFDKEQLSQSLKNELDMLNEKFHRTLKGSEVLEMSDTIAQLQKDLENDKKEAETNIQKINDLTNKLRKVEEEAHKLKQREQYVLELSERQSSIREDNEKVIREKEQVITELRTKVSTQAEHIEALLGKFSQSSYHDVLSKVLQLEEENKNLSRQLAESQRSSVTFKQEDLEGSPDGEVSVKKIQDLESENTRLYEELKISRDHYRDLENSIANKNKELIELQNQLIEIQKSRSQESLTRASPDEELSQLSNSLRTEQMKSQQLERENADLKHIVSSLEQSNKELHQDLSGILTKIDGTESYTQNLAAQTQLVSRLNARITALKNREEQALQQLVRAEEAINKLKQQFEEERQAWNTEKDSILKASKKAKVVKHSQDTQTDVKKEGLEFEWEEFESRRYEKSIADLNKEVTLYQMKHYEVLKDNHALKEKFSQKESQHVEEISRLQREIMQLEKKNEISEEQLGEVKKSLDQLGVKLDKMKDSRDELKSHFEALEKTAKSEISKLTEERNKLKLELEESELNDKRKTQQIAILFETIEGSEDIDKKLVDLAGKLGTSKAVEGSLIKQRSELMTQVINLQKKLEEQTRIANKALENDEESLLQRSKLEKINEELYKKNSELKQQLALKEYDIQALQTQYKRSQDDEKSLKEKVTLYIQQLNESQKRHAQVLAKERQDFRDNLLKVRDEKEQKSGQESDKSLVLAINQLSISLGNAGKRINEPEVFSKICKQLQNLVLLCDETILSNGSKLRELEFLVKANVYFKYLDSSTIEATDRLIDQVELLTNELTFWRNPSNMPNPEIYHSRIKELEKSIIEKEDILKNIEDESIELKRRCEVYDIKVKKLEDMLKMIELNKKAVERSCMNRAEEEIKSKLRIRDEEIRSYIDSLLSKASLDTTEGSRLLLLGREITALKIQLADFQSLYEGLCHERNSLEITNEGLSALIEESEKRDVPININIINTTNTRNLLEQKQAEIFKLKEAFETRKEENSYLQQKVARLEKELAALRNLRAQQSESEGPKEQELRKEISELKEAQRVELENIKTNCEIEIKRNKEELDLEYARKCEKFTDGNYPGYFKQQNEQMLMDIDDLLKENQRLHDENLQFTTKFQVLTNQNSKLKEELDARNQIMNDLQAGLGIETEKSQSQPAKKGKKGSLTLEKPSRPSGFAPQRLIRALVVAKMGESDACRKLRTSGKALADLRENLIKKEESVRTYEARIKGLKRYMAIQKVPEPSDEYFHEEEEEHPSIVSLKRRIREVEIENSELRLSEANAWGQYMPISNLWHQEDNVREDDYGYLIEGVIYLIDQLCESDRDSQSSVCGSIDGKKSPTIEQCQRIVIKALTKGMNKLMRGDESLKSLVEFQPSKEEDRQLWYVELLETQLNIAHNTIRNLVEFTNRISVEITGNMTSSAQYKGAAMDLAKSTKETAQELDILKQACILIRSDLEEVRGIGENIQGKDDNLYKERAILAEGMKKKLEEELLKTKLEHSYETSEMNDQINQLKAESKDIAEKFEEVLEENRKLDTALNETKKQYNKLEIEYDKVAQNNEKLGKEIENMGELRETTGKKVEKVQNDMRQWQTEHQETLISKDKLVAELQKQVKMLQDEKNKHASENTVLKKKNRELRNDIDELREAKGEPEELKMLKIKINALKDDLKFEMERNKREKEAQENKITQLEEYVNYYKSQEEAKKKEKRSKSVGRPPKEKAEKAIKEEEKELMEHTYTIQIMNLKQAYESQIQNLNTQMLALHSTLREKLTVLDDEIRKRIESENKFREFYEGQADSDKRIGQLEEEWKEEVRKLEMALARTQDELKLVKDDRDKLLQRFDEKASTAEGMAEYIKKIDQDRRSMEQEFKGEIFKLNQKIQESATKVNEFKSLNGDLKEKLNTAEKQKEELYSQIKELEHYWENATPKLEEAEKTKAQQKTKIKDYENRIRELEIEKEEIEKQYLEKVDEIRGEIKNAYAEFDKTVEKYEGQISSLKEQISLELKNRKGAKKASETIDYMMQISKKDAVIRSLKTELKSIKPKKDKKQPKSVPEEQQNEVVLLESQIYKLKAIIRNLESQLAGVKEEAQKLRVELDMNIEMHEQNRDKDQTNRKELQELERRHRFEMQRLAEEVNRIRERWHSPEDWNQLVNTNKELELALKRVSDELNRKRDLLENYKSIKDQQENETNAMQDEIEQIKDISEKLKRMKNELGRKDKAIYEMKNALEQSRESEKRLNDDNIVMAEKLRSFKNDLARKDAMIKDLKSRLDSYSSDIENGKILSDQTEKLKDQVRKLKNDCDRKDTQLKAIKVKLETTEMDLEAIQADRQNASTDAFTSLEKEIKKNEKLQQQLKKAESQLQALFNITRRIFRELSASVEGLKSKLGMSGQIDREYYSDCMDILNLDADELSEFVTPGSKSIGSTLEQIERMIDNKELDPGEVIDLFNKLVEERVELEKSSGDCAKKYEDYIKRMKQEIVHQRKAYEERIADLERNLRR